MGATPWTKNSFIYKSLFSKKIFLLSFSFGFEEKTVESAQSCLSCLLPPKVLCNCSHDMIFPSSERPTFFLLPKTVKKSQIDPSLVCICQNIPFCFTLWPGKDSQNENMNSLLMWSYLTWNYSDQWNVYCLAYSNQGMINCMIIKKLFAQKPGT